MTQRVLALVTALAAVGVGAGLPAGAAETVEEFTARVTAELRAKNPEAAGIFEKANEARNTQAWPEAESLYREVLRMEPGFVHATRRLCHAVLEQERRDEALTLCRQAFAAESSPENRAQLLDVLLHKENREDFTPAEIREAARHANVLLTQTRDLDWVLMPAACQAALLAENGSLVRRCAERLQAAAPNEGVTVYYGWVAAMVEGDLGAAAAALDKGREVGLPEALLASMQADTEEARPWYRRYLPMASWIFGAWMGGLLLLLVLGVVLSRATLRAVREPASTSTGESVGLTAHLRSAYRAVIVGSCLYYYLSIPIALALVVLGGGGLIFAFFAIGHIPIKLVLVVAIFVIVTVWAALKSLFVRVKDADPGDRLDTSAHPRLRRVLDEVAAQIGTRPVDNVYMTPGTDLAVTERGGMLKQLGGHSERCLILGAGVLDGMKMGPFRAILAHEYGHFTNRDTAGGGFALAVRRSLLTMAHHLAQGGAATWYNPVWLFLNGYHRLFLRISQGASRLQEIMADRWAAFAYGARAFEEGLRHVIVQSVRFDAHANSTLQEVVEGKMALTNLYSHRPSRPVSEDEIAKAIREQMEEKPSPYASHPSPAERFELVHALPSAGTAPSSDAADDAWRLFEDPSAIQRWMTDRVRANVAVNHGVSIPKEG